MPISIRKLDGPVNTPDIIIVDGVRRSLGDLEYLLAALDPARDRRLWDYYFVKWSVLDRATGAAS